MSDIVIKVENLSKKYTISHANGRANGEGLRHALQQAATAPWRMLRQQLRRPTSDVRHQSSSLPAPGSQLPAQSEDFWALKDVSFEVKRGEVLGIIGHNGAGKSTLLKILSRITDPTCGQIGIKGRLASLLEVGTGFHPELTGRENIFLNGAILGMSRAEVKMRFDEIIDFAGVQRFLDTPVKHYSSGMYVRLAFSVAAHLDSEILVVDEVLAVGDAEFQKKCLNRMHTVVKYASRTVLLVSHNINVINSICDSALLLDSGSLLCKGNVKTCVDHYQQNTENIGTTWKRKQESCAQAYFSEVCLLLNGRQPTISLVIKGTLRTSKVGNAMLAFDVTDESGIVVMQLLPSTQSALRLSAGETQFAVQAQLPRLIQGNYFLSLWTGPHNLETFDEICNALKFEISASPTDVPTYHHSRNHGYIIPECTFIDGDKKTNL